MKFRGEFLGFLAFLISFAWFLPVYLLIAYLNRRSTR